MRLASRRFAALHFERYLDKPGGFAYEPEAWRLWSEQHPFAPASRTISDVIDFGNAAPGDPAQGLAGVIARAE